MRSALLSLIEHYLPMPGKVSEVDKPDQKEESKVAVFAFETGKWLEVGVFKLRNY